MTKLLLYVSVLAAFAFLGAASVSVDPVNGACLDANSSYYYVASLSTCSRCPPHSSYDAKSQFCVCLTGYARIDSVGTCFSCASAGLGLSSIKTNDGFDQCSACGGSTVPAANGLLNSSFDITSGTCVCSTGYVVIETVGGVALGAQMCTPCATSAGGANRYCASCVSPYVLVQNTCVCPSSTSTTLPDDGLCVSAFNLTKLLSLGSGARLTLSPLNVDNGGSSGQAINSAVLNNFTTSSAYRCSLGNVTACNLLANLCVLSNYDVKSAPCSLYRGLQQQESCRGLACEVPVSLPWLYYLRSSSDILQDATLSFSTSLNQEIEFILKTYSWNGTWLGNQRLIGQLNSCEVPSFEAAEFYRSGTNRQSSCYVNLRWVATTASTVFYELFRVDTSSGSPQMQPVPVLMDFSASDLDPNNIFDDVIQRAAAAIDLTPQAQGYRRRFFINDNLGGIPVGGTRPQFITVARRIVLLMTIRTSTSTLYSPLLILQFQSSDMTTLLAATDFSSAGAVSLRPTNQTGGAGTLVFTHVSKTTADNSLLDNGLMITLIVVSCISFFTGWVRTYGWMRRQQTLMIGMDSLGRFFLYLINHIGNFYGIIAIITSWYVFITFKYQYSVENAVPPTSPYLFAMLYAAVACKGAVVIVKIIEQTNADVFVIDWERSKGQLLRENKLAPVSMWRSAFVTNELNEMQVLRRWRPLLSMLLIVLFLDGLSYINTATSIPAATTTLLSTASTNRILRIAICAFFWTVICLVLHLLEFQVYYRFFKVHPLQAFVDLCSVSNVSVVILLEPQWGFYIHGESIHAHADVSMEEFQINLALESQGNLPTRGLGGQAVCQTFEVFLGTYMRQYLYIKYAELAREQMMVYSNPALMRAPQIGHHRHIFEFLMGMTGASRLHSETAVAIKQQVNSAFQNSIRAAEKLLLPKFGFHAWFDFPPNVMYMNGPFAGEGSATGGKDLFFLDDSENYGSSLLYGLDADLCLFYLLLFVAIDSSLLNVYASMVITYVVDIVFVWYRSYEGEVNLGRKTLMDDRFFV